MNNQQHKCSKNHSSKIYPSSNKDRSALGNRHEKTQLAADGICWLGE